MYDLKQFTTYTQLRKAAKNFDQKNIYHDLPLLKHIDKTVQFAIDNNYSPAVIEALKWHDFGKLTCYQDVEGDENRHFYEHEHESAKIYNTTCSNPDPYISQLIKCHNFDIIGPKTFRKYGTSFSRDLINMCRADHHAHSPHAKEQPDKLIQAEEELWQFIQQEKITTRLKSDADYLTTLGYEVVGVFLQGSQNYNLHTITSDIDTKAIVLPTLDNILNLTQPISTVYEIEPDKEHLDVKDIRIMFNNCLKMNINFLEILFTKHKYLNPKYSKLISPLFINKEKLAQYNPTNLLNSISGMSMQKLAALKHPYPSLITKIEKYGYDAKQLHHILRLNEFITRWAQKTSFQDCLISKQKSYLTEIKNFKLTLQEAEPLARETDHKTKEIKNQLISNNNYTLDEQVPIIYDEIKNNILKQWFKEELNK